MRLHHFCRLVALTTAMFVFAAGCAAGEPDESVAEARSTLCNGPSPNALGAAILCAPPGGGGGGGAPPPPPLPPLSVHRWSSDAKASDNQAWKAEGASIAELNGKLYLAHCTGQAPFNPFERRDSVVWMSTFDGSAWSGDIALSGPHPSPHSLGTATLAAFSGTLYMFVVVDDNAVWWSRLTNAAALIWSPMVQTPYHSASPPAAAAGPNGLEIVGTDPATGQLWEATMSSGEAFSAAALIPGQSTTAPSAPSLVNHVPRSGAAGFYMAYTRTSGGVPSIYVAYRAYGGGSWTASPVAAAATQSPYQPALGSHDGVLHLVHAHDALGEQVSWNYLDGGAWSGEANVPNKKMFGAPALAPFHPLGQAVRLVLVHPSSHGEQFTPPPPGAGPIFASNPIWYSVFQ